jgi:hypothetical protein
MKWPDKPEIHFDCREDDQFWAVPAAGIPYRTCSICGCVHPEDLLAALRSGKTLVSPEWGDCWPLSYQLSDESGFWMVEHLLDNGYDQEALSILVEEINKSINGEWEAFVQVDDCPAMFSFKAAFVSEARVKECSK